MGDEARDRGPVPDPKGGRAIDPLELRGLKCPMPALRTQRALARLSPNAVLHVLADDPLAPLDIAHLCMSEGHTLVETQTVEAGAFRFTIRRGDDRA